MIKILLLIFFFLLAAAADCPIPQGKNHIVLTNEALLKNEFPDGSEVTFECVNGYVREAGSGTITCVDGTWTEPDLSCKKRDCGPPAEQPNMSFEFSEGGTLFGAKLTVICDKGYQLTGLAYKRCYAAGWSGRAKCEVIICDKPDEVTNGRTSWELDTTPRYGEVIKYFCDDGYTLTGNDTIVCGEFGEYSPQPPTCQGGTTKDTITAKMVTPTPTVQASSQQGIQYKSTSLHLLAEASTATDSPGTPTTHRDKTITTSSTSAASPSVRGGRDIVTAEDKITTTTAAPPVRGKQGDVDTDEDVDYMSVIVSVTCTTLVVLIVAFIIHKLLLKRKGSPNGTVPV